MVEDDHFQVEILGWEKHNGAYAKSGKLRYSHFMFSNSFFSDPKVRHLSLSAKIVYVYLLTRCSIEQRQIIDSTRRAVRQDLDSPSIDVRQCICDLEENQLLTTLKNAPLLKRKEKKGKEKERKEKLPPGLNQPQSDDQKSFLEIAKVEKPSTEQNRKCWDAYHDAYVERWKVEPTRNQVVNAAIANFVKRVGCRDAPEIIKFFVFHNDGLYLKSMHDVKLAVRDAEALRGQWLKGRAITSKDVREFEKTNHYAEQLAKVERGEI